MGVVMVECSRCKGMFSITDDTYERRKYRMKRILCPGCLRKSKDERYQKIRDKMILTWASYDSNKRAERIQNAIDGIHNMSPDAKAKRSKNSSIATARHMANRSDEERQRVSKKISEWNTTRYSNMSETERKLIGEKISEGLNKRSEEAKAISNKQRSETLKATIAAMSPEERSLRNQRVQEYWDTMTPGEYQNWKSTQAAKYSEYLSKIVVEPNSNELAFINFMNIHKIRFDFQSFNTTIHPEFNTLFPNNPVTGSKFINPYHKWDFRLFTESGDCLIDIDGSIHFNKSYKVTHHITKIEYEILDYYQFKDSQRPYQTDALPAYAILCKDDNLTYDTPVKILHTGEMIPFKSFLSIIDWMNLDEKSKRKIIKESI